MNVNINETGKHSGIMKINGGSAGETGEMAGNGNNTALRNGEIGGTELAVLKQHSIFQQIRQGARSFPGAGPVS